LPSLAVITPPRRSFRLPDDAGSSSSGTSSSAVCPAGCSPTDTVAVSGGGPATMECTITLPLSSPCPVSLRPALFGQADAWAGAVLIRSVALGLTTVPSESRICVMVTADPGKNPAAHARAPRASGPRLYTSCCVPLVLPFCSCRKARNKADINVKSLDVTPRKPTEVVIYKLQVRMSVALLGLTSNMVSPYIELHGLRLAWPVRLAKTHWRCRIR
jgi:hypothetical protein